MKNLILQKVVKQVIENNQLKCDDYSLLYSMCEDDNGQHFNHRVLSSYSEKYIYHILSLGLSSYSEKCMYHILALVVMKCASFHP